MANDTSINDQNRHNTLLVMPNDATRGTVSLWADPTTHRLLVDVGTISVSASSASVGLTGAAIPASADFLGASDGANLRGLLVESSTNPNLRTGIFNGANQMPSMDTAARKGFVEITDGTISFTAGSKTGANSFPVVIASDQTLAVSLNAGSNVIGNVGIGDGVNTVNTVAVASHTSIMVSGPYAKGSTTLPANPVYIGGEDYSGTPAVQVLKVDSSGQIYIGNTNVPANIQQIGGAALAFGQSNMAGSIPVVIASNQTSFPVAATLSAETTKVIGTVNVAASQTIAVTNTGTFAVQATPVTQVDTFMLGGVNIKEINAVTPLMGNGTTGTGSLRVTHASDNSAIALWGHGATAASVPANVTYAGAQGITALPTAVANGQSVGISADKFGRQVALLGTIRDLVGTQTTTISASTTETAIVTAVAATFLDLMMLIVSNTSTATNTRIDFRDVSGGSILFSLQSNGGQPPIGFSLGGASVPQTSVNTSWTAQCATSTTDIRVYAVFAKNK